MTTRPSVLTTTPLFVVSDLQRSLDFYAKLGFGEPGIWGEPPCFAMVHRDKFELMLSRAESPDHIRPNGPNHIWDMYIRICDVYAEIESLKAAGLSLDREPCRTEYGMIEIEVVDPDGYRVCFGQDI